jgi:hypothetical protein
MIVGFPFAADDARDRMVFWYEATSFADLFILTLGVAALVQRTLSLPAGRPRAQMRTVAAGGALLIVTLLMWNQLELWIPAAEGNFHTFTERLAGATISLSGVFLGVALLIALFRFGMYDGNKLVSRSLVYSLLASALALILLVAEHLVARFADTAPDTNDAVSKLAAAAFALVVVTPLRSSILAWADRNLRAPLAELTQQLPQSLEDMRGLATVEDVLLEAANRTRKALHPAWLAFVLGDKVAYAEDVEPHEVRAWLDATGLLHAPGEPPHDPADTLFPFRVPMRVHSGPAGEPLGWLLVGPPEEGGAYSDEDRAAVCAVGTPLARAIRAVRPA